MDDSVESMYVVKRSGEREAFDPSKVRASLVRSGTSNADADRVMEQLRPQLYDGITTEEIYRRVNKMLDADRKVRFGLKKAILNLGPDGYRFEDFVARLFAAQGYDTQVRQTLHGQCVTHEVDVVLQKDGKKSMVECKFHNSQGIKCGIQTVLYTYGRFLDLSHMEQLDEVWLLTNTRFSSDVVHYAECMNIKLLGWKYPEVSGLETLVEKQHLYPVTVLDLRRPDLRTLLDHDIVLVKDLMDNIELVKRLLPGREMDRIAHEAQALLR
jgi:hypothetical protein